MKTLYAIIHKPSGNIVRRGVGHLRVYETKEKAEQYIENLEKDGIVKDDYEIEIFFQQHQQQQEILYRVSFNYFLKSIGFEGRYTHDFKSLDKAIEYMDNRKSKEAGKDFTIEKVVTTYEVIASG